MRHSTSERIGHLADATETPRPHTKKRRKVVIWISVILTVVLLAVGASFWWYSSVQNEASPELPDDPEVGTWYPVSTP